MLDTRYYLNAYVPTRNEDALQAARAHRTNPHRRLPHDPGARSPYLEHLQY